MLKLDRDLKDLKDGWIKIDFKWIRIQPFS